ncbi:MAG: hypothetical protein LBP79_06855 [Clostridiales bacterium]|nr:hypothetical protein [Clostridiales bacterium]
MSGKSGAAVPEKPLESGRLPSGFEKGLLTVTAMNRNCADITVFLSQAAKIWRSDCARFRFVTVA